MKMPQSSTYDESSPLLKTIPPITDGSIGVPSTVVEPPNVYKSRWWSIRVMYLTMFLSSISFSICMSSIWPYLQVLDKDANADFLGWVVAIYSLGQLMASPFFGWWANCRMNSRLPLVVSLIINILANVMYIYIESIPNYRKYCLLVARFFIGFGAGNVAVVRSYVSGATTIKERTTAMANMSACQAVGFIIGPVFQTALVPIGYPGPIHCKEFYLNLYTAPALLSAACGVINTLLLFLVFREHRVFDDEDINYSIQSSGSQSNYSPDYCGIASSILLFFVVLFVFSVFETIGTPLTMDMYDWTKKQATLYNGIILATAGVISIGVFMVLKVISKRVNERYLLLGGFVFCLAGFITWLPWGSHYPNRSVAPINPASNVSVNTTTETTESPGNTTMEPVGCPWDYSWCSYTPQIYLAQFLGGTLLIAIGYPTCNVMSYTLYSKILGPKPQGIWMGFLTAAGSLARTLGPVFVSQVYAFAGPRVTFSSMVGLIFITIIFLVAIFKKLIPFSFVNSYVVST